MSLRLDLVHVRLCILLRWPFVRHPELGLSSGAILARSVTKVLQAYTLLADGPVWHPKWAELRRIATCGHLLVFCYDEGEMSRPEAEGLASVVMELLEKLDGGCVGSAEVRQSVTALLLAAGGSEGWNVLNAGLLDLARSDSGSLHANGDWQDYIRFDYS